MATTCSFTNDEDVALISLVRQYPVIYDQSHAKYTDYGVRDSVWKKIGERMKKPRTMCKSRWINIRDMMRRRVRNRAKNMQKGKCLYKYEQELDFLLPIFNETNSSKVDDCVYFSGDEESSAAVECNMQVEGADAGDEDYKSFIFQTKNSDEVSVDLQQLEGAGGGSRLTLDPVNNIDAFLMSVGATLRKLSPYYQNQAKSKIFQVISEYELQQIIDTDGVPGAGRAVSMTEHKPTSSITE